MQQWYYDEGGEQRGPVGLDKLQTLAREGVVTAETYVWTEGMPNWKHAATVDALHGVLPSVPAPSGPPAGPVTAPPELRAERLAQPLRPQVNSHLPKAILATLFCCLPVGIVAIVYAAQVRGRLDFGDLEGAERLSKSANGWANAAIIIGVLLFVVLIFGFD